MSQLMLEAAQALQPLPAQVIRGWPQALVDLPGCVLCLLEDRWEEDGARRAALGLTLRASTPEQADDLAMRARTLLAPLGWRQSACKDGAERDGSCFHKLLRMDRTFPPPGALPQTILLRAQDTLCAVALLRRDMERAPVVRTTLADGAPRLHPGPLCRHSLRVLVPLEAAAAFTQAFHQGLPVAAEADTFLVTALSQQEGALQATLHQTL